MHRSDIQFIQEHNRGASSRLPQEHRSSKQHRMQSTQHRSSRQHSTRSAQPEPKKTVSEDYFNQMKEYYESAIHQIQGEYHKESSQLRNTIGVLDQNIERQKTEMASLKQDNIRRIAESEKINNDLIERLRTISVSNILDDNMKCQYTKDLANKNVQVAQLQQEIESVKSEHFTELHNQQITYTKRLADYEQKRRLEIEKVKMEYEPQIAILKRNLEEQKKTSEKKMQDDIQKIQSKYNNAVQLINEEFEKKEKQYKIKEKQVVGEKESIITELTSRYKNIKNNSDYLTKRLEETTNKLAESEVNRTEEVCKIKSSHSEELREQIELVNMLRSKVKYLHDINTKYVEEIKQIKQDRDNTEERANIELNTLRHRARQFQSNSEKSHSQCLQKEEDLIAQYQNKFAQQIQKIATLSDKCAELEPTRERYNNALKLNDGLKTQNREYVNRLKSLEETISDLKREKQEVVARCTELVKVVEFDKKKIATLTKQVNIADMEKKELTTAVNFQCQQMDKMEKNYRDIQDKYHNVLKSTSTTLKDEQELIKHLKEELAKLTLQVSEMDNLKMELRNKDTQFYTLGNNVQKLNSSLTQKTLDYEEYVVKWSALNTEYKQQSDQLDKQKQVNQKYENKISQLQLDGKKLQTSLVSLEKEYREKCDALSSTKELKEGLDTQYNVVKNKIHSLDAQVSNLTVERDNMSSKNKDLHVINDDLEKMTTTLKKNINTSNQKCIELSEQVSTLKKENGKIRKEFDNAVQSHVKLVETLNEKIQTHTQDIKELKKQLVDYEQTHKDYTRLIKENQEQKKLILSSQTEYFNLQSNYGKAFNKLQTEMVNMKQELNTLTEQLQVAETRALSFEQQVEDIPKLEEQLEEYEKTIGELNQYKYKCVDTENSRDKYKSLYKNIIVENERLKSVENEHTRLSALYKDLKSANHILQNANNNSSSQKEGLQKTITNHTLTISIQEKTIRKLQEELDNKTRMESELTKKILKLQNSYQQEKSTLMIRFNKYDEQYKKMETDLAFTQGKLSNIEENDEKLLRLTNETQGLLNQLGKTKQINEELKHRMAELEKQLESERCKYVELQPKCTALRDNCTELTRKLEKTSTIIENNNVLHKTSVDKFTTELNDLTRKNKDLAEKAMDIRQKNALVCELEQQCKKYQTEVENNRRSITEMTDNFNTLQKKYTLMCDKYKMSELYKVLEEKKLV